MNFSYSAHSADHADESKPRSRRRAGGRYKKSQPLRSRQEPVRSKPRRPAFDDDFEDFGDDDLGDFDIGLEEDEDLDDLDDDLDDDFGDDFDDEDR